MKNWILILYALVFTAAGFIGGFLIGKRNTPKALQLHSVAYSKGFYQTREASLSEIEARVEPLYPEKALRDRIGGTVWVRVQIDGDGSVSSCDIVKSVRQDLDAAAVQAAVQWKFKPMEQDGNVVPGSAVIPFTFVLDSTVSSREGHILITAPASKRVSPTLIKKN